MSDTALLGPDAGIPAAEVMARIDRLKAAVEQRGLPGALVVGRPFYERPANVAYLANHFPPFPTAMFWGHMQGLGHSALVIPVGGQPVLIVDTTFRPDMVPIADVRRARARSQPATAFLPNFGEAIADVLNEKGLGGGRLGLVGDDVLPLRLARDITERLPRLILDPCDDILARMRMVKSPAELALHRAAAAVCDAGYGETQPCIRPDATEREICAAGLAATMRAGADFVRYVRTYSGPHAAAGVRWPQATDRRVSDGEIVVLDIVGAARGQQFDVNRTFVVGRRATDRQKRQLDAALDATRAAIAAARPGVAAGALVTAANQVIEDRGFGQHARPFIGHGIGYETMEPPLLLEGEQTLLEPGMVLCIEPGIEIPGEDGVRIEEEVIVTDGAAELITRFPPRQWE